MFSNNLAVRICGTGSFLPGNPVSNDELITRGVDSSSQWIFERTGISFRHLASSETVISDIALAAAKSALTEAQISATDIDLIIVATSTPEMIFPSTACILQAKLGNVGATAFDIQAVCSGFVYALTIAEKFLKSGSHKRALVVGAELFSRIMDWQDRTTCVLFGDGAGAVVLEAYDSQTITSDNSNNNTKSNILASILHADGSGANILKVNAAVSAGNIIGDPFLRMDGQSVFKIAVRVLAEAANEVCALAKCELTSIDWLIPHQANIRIINSTCKKLGLNENQAIVTVAQHGNTSAASIPLALDWAIRNNKIMRGQRLLLEGVGGGFTWGAVLVDY